MTVGELKKALKGYKNEDEVFMVKDWEIVDEDGHLTELAELKDVTSQRIVVHGARLRGPQPGAS